MTVVAETNDELPEAPAPGEHHAHPTDSTYWTVGGVLAALTLLEVTTYWWPEEWHKVTFWLLIIMMAIKFVLVALFFMHLRFDPKLLKRTFFFGLSLALAVYLVMLSTFLFWNDSGNLDETYPDPPRGQQPPPPLPPS